MSNMTHLWILLLATVAYACTPMSQQQWIQFVEAPDPCYNVSETEEIQPEIISAKYIDVRKSVTQIGEMVKKTMTEFGRRYQQYAKDICSRIKRATESQQPYGFVRKPELRHQYGMLFNHHGYVVSGLKNLELFLSIKLPKVTDILHTPPPYPDCNNWAVTPPPRRDGYLDLSLGFSTSKGLM